ncbi:MAG: hypothetical protein IJ887_13855 [Prevotella sp.]|nr:hypothetical protein [Prevotella sp.]MBR3480692.1 hypothetical protein [Prevotella sp.]MBR6188187.1 hypothetical protein [Prevotella sp.]
MKTQYQAPAIEFLFADSESLLEGSLPQTLTDGQDLGNAPTTDATKGNLSRINIWDNDEE